MFRPPVPPLPVYIINMDKDTKRWNTVSKRFIDKGFAPIRRRGYDVSRMDLSSYVTKGSSNGIIGCALSHIEIWKEFLRSNNEYVLIAEDDAAPLFESEYVRNVISQAPRDADFIHLGCDIACSDSSFVDKLLNRFYTRCIPKDVNSHMTQIQWIAGTHAYYLTREGATKLLTHIRNNLSVHIDFQMSNVPGLVKYGTKPILISYDVTGVCTSNISNKDRWKCIFDKVIIAGNRTLGYILFTPVLYGLDIFSMLCICICVIFGFYGVRNCWM